MRTLLLAGTSLLALAAASIPGADAAPITFTPTGGLQTYAVATTSLYDILAVGAQGGASDANFARGGYGEQVSDAFYLAVGDVLTIAGGGAGLNGFTEGGAGGGGGTVGSGGSGSVVITPPSTPSPGPTPVPSQPASRSLAAA